MRGDQITNQGTRRPLSFKEFDTRLPDTYRFGQNRTIADLAISIF